MIDHLSYSSISTYLKCHRRWKHRYIDGWQEPDSDALKFGSTFHELIRQDMAHVGAYDLNLGWDELFHTQFANGDEQITNENLLALYEVGAKMVNTIDIRDTIKSLKPMPESIERKFELHIPGVEIPVIGFIDMIEDNTIIPVDFKTASRKWPAGRADNELQATFYIAAMEQAGMIALPHTFRYIVFTKTSKPTVQIIETERTAAHVFELHEMVNDVWKAIQSKSFGKCDPSMWWCSQKWCGFYDRCKGA